MKISDFGMIIIIMKNVRLFERAIFPGFAASCR